MARADRFAKESLSSTIGVAGGISGPKSASASLVGVTDYTDEVNALQGIGNFVKDIGVKQAKDQAVVDASSVVVRNADGSLVPPTKAEWGFTPYGEVYNQTIMSRYADETMLDVNMRLGRLAEDHAGDPEEFRKSAQSYTDTLADNLPPEVQGQVKLAMRQRSGEYELKIDKDKRDFDRKEAQDVHKLAVETTVSDYVDMMANGITGQKLEDVKALLKVQKEKGVALRFTSAARWDANMANVETIIEDRKVGIAVGKVTNVEELAQLRVAFASNDKKFVSEKLGIPIDMLDESTMAEAQTKANTAYAAADKNRDENLMAVRKSFNGFKGLHLEEFHKIPQGERVNHLDEYLADFDKKFSNTMAPDDFNANKRNYAQALRVEANQGIRKATSDEKQQVLIGELLTSGLPTSDTVQGPEPRSNIQIANSDSAMDNVSAVFENINPVLAGDALQMDDQTFAGFMSLNTKVGHNGLMSRNLSTFLGGIIQSEIPAAGEAGAFDRSMIERRLAAWSSMANTDGGPQALNHLPANVKAMYLNLTADAVKYGGVPQYDRTQHDTALKMKNDNQNKSNELRTEFGTEIAEGVDAGLKDIRTQTWAQNWVPFMGNETPIYPDDMKRTIRNKTLEYLQLMGGTVDKIEGASAQAIKDVMIDGNWNASPVSISGYEQDQSSGLAYVKNANDVNFNYFRGLQTPQEQKNFWGPILAKAAWRDQSHLPADAKRLILDAQKTKDYTRLFEVFRLSSKSKRGLGSIDVYVKSKAAGGVQSWQFGAQIQASDIREDITAEKKRVLIDRAGRREMIRREKVAEWEAKYGDQDPLDLNVSP